MKDKIMVSMFFALVGILFSIGIVSAGSYSDYEKYENYDKYEASVEYEKYSDYGKCCSYEVDSMQIEKTKLIAGYEYDDSMQIDIRYKGSTKCDCIIDYDSVKVTDTKLVRHNRYKVYQESLAHQDPGCVCVPVENLYKKKAYC